MLKASSFALLALFGAAPLAVAGTIKVPQDYATIQAAINASVNGDLITVSQGTYHEYIDFLGKAITLQGANSSNTLIDGNGAGGSIVTMKSGETASTVITRISIKKGTGTSVGGKLIGGGIYLTGGSDPTIIDCKVGFNTALWGAGIFIDVGCDPLIQDSLFANNVTGSGGLGGGLYIAGNPTLDNNRIAENTATVGFGGGAYTLNSKPTIANGEFDSNIAWYGGGLHVQGGAPSITGNLFEQNIVTVNPTNGEGAGLSMVAGSTAWVSGNEFRYNNAHSGAGIYSYDSSPTIITNLIHENTAATNSSGGFGYGGGMSLGKTKGSVELNEIYLNTAALGGGVATRSSTTVLLTGNVIDTNDTGTLGVGGGIYSKDSSPTILGSTIAANNASKGGGVYVIGKSAPTIDTAIIFFNTAGSNISFYDATGLLTFGFSDVEAASLGGSSLSIDPQFANLAARDFSLLSSSPVIDAGNFFYTGPASDVYGNTRIVGGRVDMGASEF
ncbi:MAG: hypothetical protein EXS13_03875 [Planctomycetes bacterium]|nr:hypothetical protein [Planctomycetota bacterium]